MAIVNVVSASLLDIVGPWCTTFAINLDGLSSKIGSDVNIMVKEVKAFDTVLEYIINRYGRTSTRT